MVVEDRVEMALDSTFFNKKNDRPNFLKISLFQIVRFDEKMTDWSRWLSLLMRQCPAAEHFTCHRMDVYGDSEEVEEEGEGCSQYLSTNFTVLRSPLDTRNLCNSFSYLDKCF